MSKAWVPLNSELWKSSSGCHNFLSIQKKCCGRVKEFMWQSKWFNHCHRNLLASVSWSQLSHKEYSEWHCHKITELEIAVQHTVVLRRKCYLFILGLPSSPSPKSRGKTLGVWCFSIVSTPLFTVQMNSSEDLFFTANHFLLGSNEYSKSHLLALYRKRK